MPLAGASRWVMSQFELQQLLPPIGVFADSRKLRLIVHNLVEVLARQFAVSVLSKTVPIVCQPAP